MVGACPRDPDPFRKSSGGSTLPHSQPASDGSLQLLTVAETARLLHLNVKRVQALARAGKLPAARVGRKWLFPRDRIEALLGTRKPATPAPQAGGVELSARNQLRARVTGLTVDGLMCEVRLDLGGQELVAVITRSSAERLQLSVGANVLAVIKSTEVMIGRS